MSLNTRPTKPPIKTGTNLPASVANALEEEAKSGTPIQPITTYSDFLQTLPGEYEAYLNRELKNAEDQRTNAYNNAEETRSKSIIDANTAYQHNLATYGAKAEALASMGLTGSGYSDYLNAQAYAEQRADIRDAKAEAAEDKRLADDAYNKRITTAQDKYDENILKAKEKIFTYKESIYDNLLKGAQEGAYTSKQIENFAQLYELSEEQKTSLLDVVAPYETEIKSEIVSYITPDTTDEKIQSYVNSGYFDDAEELKGARTKAVIKEIEGYISSGDFASMQSKADAAYGKGYISLPEYQKMYYDACIKNCASNPPYYSEQETMLEDVRRLGEQGKLTRADVKSIEKYIKDVTAYSAIGLDVGEVPIPAITATNEAFQRIQSFIDINGLREGDRNRWGQAFRSAGLLDIYNRLSSQEKAALIGKE